MDKLSTDGLCTKFRDTWIDFFHMSSACVRDEKVLSELQDLLNQYDNECTKRGIRATPCTVSGQPDMLFEL
jgi:hypothetical protein